MQWHIAHQKLEMDKLLSNLKKVLWIENSYKQHFG